MNFLFKAFFLLFLGIYAVSAQAEYRSEYKTHDDFCTFMHERAEKMPTQKGKMYLNPDYDAHINKSIYGNDVPAATIGGDKRIILPEEFRFNLTLDLAEKTGIGLPEGIHVEQSLGQVIYRNGEIFLGDEKLSDDDVAKLENYCK